MGVCQKGTKALGDFVHEMRKGHTRMKRVHKHRWIEDGERSQYKTLCVNKCYEGVGLGELGSAPIKVYGTVLLLCHVEGCTVLSKGGHTVNVKTHPPPINVFSRAMSERVTG